MGAALRLFEPGETPVNMGQIEHLYAQCPIWLEGRNINITSQFVCTCGERCRTIFKVFEIIGSLAN